MKNSKFLKLKSYIIIFSLLGLSYSNAKAGKFSDILKSLFELPKYNETEDDHESISDYETQRMLQEKEAIEVQKRTLKAKSKSEKVFPEDKKILENLSEEREKSRDKSSKKESSRFSKKKLAFLAFGSAILAYLIYKIGGQNNTEDQYKKID